MLDNEGCSRLLIFYVSAGTLDVFHVTHIYIDIDRDHQISPSRLPLADFRSVEQNCRPPVELMHVLLQHHSASPSPAQQTHKIAAG